MQFQWSGLGAAFALYLVLEGIMPFLNPQGLKRALSLLGELGDRQLRVAGLISMLSGLALLHLVSS
jgi:uncharacterized protein YjeT (DUF2065 family)